MRLVVGLGNPGNEFVGTRHNIGWEVLDAMAVRLGFIAGAADFNAAAKTKFDGWAIDGNVNTPAGAEKVLLLKPTTYMNLSGRAVQAAAAFYQLTPADLIVVLDDLALPCGRLRIRKGGSPGGHNGLKDIERAMATDQYPRLRIGIDPAPPRIPGRDYVLGRFTRAQRDVLDPAVTRAVDALLMWIEKGIDPAMNAFNVDATSEK
jgi:PTH1 family peptidyl-tRNA hydrolase